MTAFDEVARRRRDEEDAAAVIAVVTALASGTVPEDSATPVSTWADPAARLGRPLPGGLTWWASAPRRGAGR